MRPFQRLPVPFPKDYDPGVEYFYNNFASHFVADTIKMMVTGLHIDDVAVESLRGTITEVLENVDSVLLRNKYIQKYQAKRSVSVQKAHFTKCTEAIREPSHYYKDYDNSVIHRTWLVNTYITSKDWIEDLRGSWTVKDLKNYNIFKDDLFLSKIIDKSFAKKSKIVIKAMEELAKYKSELWNRPRYDRASSKAPVDAFNPGSAKQKQELFAMLNVTPIAYSDDTGEASWGREYIEEIKKQLNGEDEILDEILQCFIDHSYSGIIRNNFLKAFDTYTIDGVMHGNVKVFGAKTFRPTSNSPNLLNAPSTRSIYAKPLKKCFIAPGGYAVYAIDFAALEDRVIADLSGDINKQNIFLEGLDGHSLNACGYFPEEIEKLIGHNEDNVEYVKRFKSIIDSDDSDKDVRTALDGIRFKGKAPTFKLAYGGYPDAHKGGVITQDIFDNYHNVLYPGITEYRENYVLKKAVEDGYIHLGLGCRIYSDNPDKDIRTLHNATAQFWSILTLITVNEINHRVEEKGLSDDIMICSTIYDSIYVYVKKDAETIKWLNDTAVEIMCSPYLENQVVHNAAVGELGNNWADLSKVPNNSSIEEINKILKQL